MTKTAERRKEPETEKYLRMVASFSVQGQGSG